MAYIVSQAVADEYNRLKDLKRVGISLMNYAKMI